MLDETTTPADNGTTGADAPETGQEGAAPAKKAAAKRAPAKKATSKTAASKTAASKTAAKKAPAKRATKKPAAAEPALDLGLDEAAAVDEAPAAPAGQILDEDSHPNPCCSTAAGNPVPCRSMAERCSGRSRFDL